MALKHGQYQREMNAQCQQKKRGDHEGRKGGTDCDVDDKANIALVRARYRREETGYSTALAEMRIKGKRPEEDES